MNTPVLTFFNNKGGVGKTSLVYHLAWTFADLGKRVLVMDLDSQANLTAAFIDEKRIEAIWDKRNSGSTIHQCIEPLIEVADITEPVLHTVSDNLHLLPGDVRLAGFEDTLSGEWPNSLGNRNLYRPMRILTAFWQVIQMASRKVEADLVLVDVGPNLGAINRSALIATDYVAIPLGADLFSLQGLRNLGPTLKDWRSEWKKRLENWGSASERDNHPDFELPNGSMQPIGYLCQQHGVRLDRPVQAYERWVQKMPGFYREFILEENLKEPVPQKEDKHCLSTIKHYHSLVPMGQEHRKPIFKLTAADGAIGAHSNAVQSAKNDFRELAEEIAKRMGMAV